MSHRLKKKCLARSVSWWCPLFIPCTGLHRQTPPALRHPQADHDHWWHLTCTGLCQHYHTMSIIDARCLYLAQGYIHKTNTVSVILKLVITLSTIWLLVAVVAFHVTGIHLSMVDNGIEDWRLVTLPQFVCCVSASWSRWFWVVL